jgi:cytidylate kinase
MNASVICISRTFFAGGETVGRLVAERLGIRYVDDEVIQLASEKAKVDPALVERAEHRVPILARLIDALGGPIEWSAPPEGYYTATINVLSRPTSEALRSLIRAAIVEIADRGNAVIVAHAASFALTGRADVLRVLVTASFATRVERLAEIRLMERAESEALVRESDRERQLYLRRFYEISEESPTHYDVVVNTDRVDVGQAVQVVLSAARS